MRTHSTSFTITRKRLPDHVEWQHSVKAIVQTLANQLGHALQASFCMVQGVVTSRLARAMWSRDITSSVDSNETKFNGNATTRFDREMAGPQYKLDESVITLLLSGHYGVNLWLCVPTLHSGVIDKPSMQDRARLHLWRGEVPRKSRTTSFLVSLGITKIRVDPVDSNTKPARWPGSET